MDSPPTLALKNPPLAALLAWLAPGLGHLYQGRIGKAVLFFVCIIGLFVTGYVQGGNRVVYFRWDESEYRWPYLAQVGVGLPALPALLHQPKHRTWLPASLQTFEARPYTIRELDELCAMYNVPQYHSESERVRLLREQHNIHLVSSEDLDEKHREIGKPIDIALICTIVAGLLNFLVIFDAAWGPALYDEEEKHFEGKSKPAEDAA